METMTNQIDAPVLRPMQAQEVLTPDTPVIIVQRGGDALLGPVRDKYDGIEWEIPEGHWTVPYGVALHLQQRAIIPGTRNAVSGKSLSRIGILRTASGTKAIDPSDRCEPFHDAEVASWAGRVEALDRSAMEADQDRNVQVMDARTLRAHLLQRQINIDGRVEQSRAAQLAMTEPIAPDDNEAMQEIAAAEAAVGPRGRR